ncbi:MAG: type II toxin-antitoxin system VapC family toxin [Planctomycetaceae bacterium]|jgi:PIN domain nuclease of toxin-antitoxin system|nr:type II toxin-antitoxin system VapC family toxin [Planctomycetaceae bacterium]
MNGYVLDACALIALLQDEAGADKVAEIINMAYNGDVTIVMNKLNLLEVYYDAYRLRGKIQADEMLTQLKKQPIVINSEITDDLFIEAGRLKASHKISLADSIALAEASVHDRMLITADHHEFDVVEKNEKISFLWFR